MTGDRVGICSRNCIQFLVAFWASREFFLSFSLDAFLSHGSELIGAVAVLANASVTFPRLRRLALTGRKYRWLPLEPLSHCLAHTQCRLVILDPERAERLQSVVPHMYRETDVEAILVFDFQERKPSWDGMRYFEETLREYSADGTHILTSPISILPEDNSTVIFTSGRLASVTSP